MQLFRRKGATVAGVRVDLLAQVLTRASEYCLPGANGKRVFFVRRKLSKEAWVVEAQRGWVTGRGTPILFEREEPSVSELLMISDQAAVGTSAIKPGSETFTAQHRIRNALYNCIVLVLGLGDQALEHLILVVHQQLAHGGAKPANLGGELLRLVHFAPRYGTLDSLLAEIDQIPALPEGGSSLDVSDLGNLIRAWDSNHQLV